MSLLKKLFSHELINGSFYIFLGSMVANFLAFLLNLFLARNLSYADYAIFASLLSVITLASIPASSISTVIMKFATEYFAKGQYEKIKIFYLKMFKFIFSLSFLIFLGFMLFSIFLKNFLHLDNVLYIILTGFTVSVTYLFIMNAAFLQSLLKFAFISFVSVIGGIVKLLVGVILVLLGYRAFGGIWAIFFMTFISFIVGYVPLRKILAEKYKNEDVVIKTSEIYSYAVPAFIISFFLTSFTSMDVILVKHFFSASQAGFYAGISLIGKVIFYFTSPIPVVMFPLLVKRHSTGSNFKNLFYLALLLVVLPSFAITIFYFFFPEFVIKLFLGGRHYLSIAPYLGLFGFYITIFSMVNVCVSLFLSLNKTKIMPLVVLGAIFQIILICLFHNSFFQVIGVSVFVTFILLIFLLIYFLKNYGELPKLKGTIPFVSSPG